MRDGGGKGPKMSPVDLKWGRLFDGSWRPIERLRDVYRGIANYLVRTQLCVVADGRLTQA